MTVRTLPCDTLSNSTEVDSPSQFDIMDIMGRSGASKVYGGDSISGRERFVYFAERDGRIKIGTSNREEIAERDVEADPRPACVVCADIHALPCQDACLSLQVDRSSRRPSASSWPATPTVERLAAVLTETEEGR